MAEFVQCPQCGLKHTRREDGLCPRCKNASASAPAPAAAPIVEPLKAGEPEKPGVATAGSRAAGILLLANAALLLASFVIAPGQGGFAAGPHGVILDSVARDFIPTRCARRSRKPRARFSLPCHSRPQHVILKHVTKMRRDRSATG